MSFIIPIEISRDFTVNCGYDKVFGLLADVPASVSHFPKVENLVDLGDEVYRWEMQKIGLSTYTIQTIYACRYTNSYDEGWVEWKPVPDEGNAQVEGFWNLEEDDGDVVSVEFYTKGDFTMNFPSLAKIVLGPLVSVEFNSLVDKYIANLKKTLQA